MAVPLNTYTTIEQLGVVRFLWAKNMEAKDIHKEMLPMYGEHCLSRQAVHNVSLKHHLSGKSFPVDDAVERAVCAWFRQQPKEFYTAGFQKLVKRWDKCLNLYGDYVENKCCLYVIISIRFFSITICNLLIELLSYITIHGPLNVKPIYSFTVNSAPKTSAFKYNIYKVLFFCQV
jgi:hypothetical protein